MNLILRNDLFRTAPPFRLLAAVQQAIEQQHQIAPLDPNCQEYREWLERCSRMLDTPDAVDLLQMQLAQSVLVVSKRSFTIVGAASQPNRDANEFSFDQLTGVLLRTFRIYVENGRADKNFILAIVPAELKQDLQQLISMGAVTFENAGGIGELKAKIEHDFQAIALLSSHSFAVFDSDAPAPGEPSAAAVAAGEACGSRRIPFLCLDRRAIENYLPVSSIEEFADGQSIGTRAQRLRMARQLRKLSRDQFAHIHLKKGLRPPESTHPLFAQIDAAAKLRLECGLGDELSSCFATPGAVTRDRFAAAGSLAEIDLIAKSILEVL